MRSSVLGRCSGPGELLDSISCILNITAKDLMKAAEIGELRSMEAICTADDQDNVEFFEEAYGPTMSGSSTPCCAQ